MFVEGFFEKADFVKGMACTSIIHDTDVAFVGKVSLPYIWVFIL